MRLASLFAIALLFGSGMAARADVFYSFNGAGVLAGTTFSIDAPGFLSYSANPVKPASGELVFPGIGGGDNGPVDSVYFYSGHELAAANANAAFDTRLTYNIGALGSYSNDSGTLTISAAPYVTVAPTPEPASFALMGTGLLGVVGLVRRRLTL